MRVLEPGCGRGDVSLLLAACVGGEGEVVGIDRDAGALAEARERLGGAPARFVRADLAEPPRDLGRFDAIVGRRVLMYLADPAAVLARYVPLLRAGGIVAFQEHDATITPGRHGAWPLHDRIVAWLRAMVEAEGGDPGIGLRLPGILARAGLEVEGVWAEAVIQGQDTHHPLPVILHAVAPRIVAQGIATEAELGLDGLEAHLAAERAANASLYVSDMAFCAWARSPA